jgi:hypothetical protein
MQTPENKDIKRLRILKLYQELSRHKIDYEECLKFMSYQFCLAIPYLIYIIKNNRIEDFSETTLDHFDLDLKLIDAFANKLFVEAKKERKEQLNLFLEK